MEIPERLRAAMRGGAVSRERAATAEAYVTVPRLAAEMGTKPEEIRRYASRTEDPLPLRYFFDKERSGFVIVRELDEWLERNTWLHVEKRKGK